MTKILKFSDREIKIAMITMLMNLVKKLDMQKKIECKQRDRDSNKESKEKLEIENTVVEKQNASHGLFSKLHTAK